VVGFGGGFGGVVVVGGVLCLFSFLFFCFFLLLGWGFLVFFVCGFFFFFSWVFLFGRVCEICFVSFFFFFFFFSLGFWGGLFGCFVGVGVFFATGVRVFFCWVVFFVWGFFFFVGLGVFFVFVFVFFFLDLLGFSSCYLVAAELCVSLNSFFHSFRAKPALCLPPIRPHYLVPRALLRLPSPARNIDNASKTVTPPKLLPISPSPLALSAGIIGVATFSPPPHHPTVGASYPFPFSYLLFRPFPLGVPIFSPSRTAVVPCLTLSRSVSTWMVLCLP